MAQWSVSAINLHLSGNATISGTLTVSGAVYASTLSNVSTINGFPYVTGGLPKFGNILLVDSVNGSDAIASRNGYPFSTVNAAVSNTVGGDTVWIMPGVYNLSEGLNMRANTSIRGQNTQQCFLQLCNATADTTLVTISDNCRIEDVTLKLHSTAHHNLTGILYNNTTSRTAKLRTCVLTLDNSNAGPSGTSRLVGIDISGSSVNLESSFSFDILRGTTVNVFSDGSGQKRGIYINQSGSSSIRDVNVLVTTPTTATSSGSYVGVETAHSNALFFFKTCSIAGPTYTNNVIGYTYSDILQSTGSLSIGPGTDLVNKTAGGRSVDTFVYPTTLFYGLKGDIKNAAGTVGYLWPGTMAVQTGTPKYPDSPVAWYRIQQNAILVGLMADIPIAPGAGQSISGMVLIERANSGAIVDTSFTFLYTTTSGQQGNYNQSVDLRKGDRLGMILGWSPGNGNAARDLAVQLDLV